MHSIRQRKGSRKIISQQHQLNGPRTTFAKSLPVVLIKKCAAHPKTARALFVASLFLWVGFVAIFVYKLPPNRRHDARRIISSPTSARNSQARQLRTPSSIHIRTNDAIKPHSKQNELKMELNRHSPRDAITALRLSQLPSPNDGPNDVASNLSRIENGRKSYLKKGKKAESMRQSTYDALRNSNPYAQKEYSVMSPPSKRIDAFAAQDYYDTRTMMGEDDDSLDTYYAVDDDAQRGIDYKDDDEETTSHRNKKDKEKFCTTPTFYRLYRPTCNEVHSTVSGYQWLTTGAIEGENHHRSRYLGSGAYRQVFLLERQYASNDVDEVVYKTMKRFTSNGRTLEEKAAYSTEEVNKNFELYDDMRKDSMVMEQLTSSPRIADIYSFCALSSIIEYAPGNIEKYAMPTEGYERKKKRGDDDDNDDPTPVNDYIKPLEKLEMALELAKGLATMHGHSDGVIANVDVQIGQFCRGKDGLIKVLDFNRAEVMLYDKDKDKYCKFENGIPPDGSLRAPEEIIDSPLTEKIDVYTLGNVIYSILTGLLVNRDYGIKQAHQRIRKGKTEFIDEDYFNSRSPAEMALVKVIRWCWTFDVTERPSIFQVVEFLEDELRKNLIQ